jgi:hypothetical protein
LDKALADLEELVVEPADLEQLADRAHRNKLAELGRQAAEIRRSRHGIRIKAMKPTLPRF